MAPFYDPKMKFTRQQETLQRAYDAAFKIDDPAVLELIKEKEIYEKKFKIYGVSFFSDLYDGTIKGRLPFRIKDGNIHNTNTDRILLTVDEKDDGTFHNPDTNEIYLPVVIRDGSILHNTRTGEMYMPTGEEDLRITAEVWARRTDKKRFETYGIRFIEPWNTPFGRNITCYHEDEPFIRGELPIIIKDGKLHHRGTDRILLPIEKGDNGTIYDPYTYRMYLPVVIGDDSILYNSWTGEAYMSIDIEEDNTGNIEKE